MAVSTHRTGALGALVRVSGQQGIGTTVGVLRRVISISVGLAPYLLEGAVRTTFEAAREPS
jgi:hypothetical protein